MKNKWKEDLVCDIRTGNTEYDNSDGPFGNLLDIPKYNSVEFTLCNHNALERALNECGSQLKYVLEIGVCRNGNQSSTYTILKYLSKYNDSVYLGVDIEDKSFLNDQTKGIFTIKENSSNYENIKNKLDELKINELDFIFIDGWHSINQVLDDWEYTRLLRGGGVVAFHDVTSHPGPHFFIKNINTDKWKVVGNLCSQDHGFGYAVKL
jgi:hypothetical protein